MDRLDRLTQRLVADLDRQADRPGRPADCVEPELLERFAEGRLDSPTQARADAHLNDCLACLSRVVELRDYAHGLAAPAAVSGRLERDLDTLIGKRRGEGLWARGAESVRRVLVFRIPAWAVVGATVAMLVTWSAAHKLQGPDTRVDWPFSDPTSSERLKPAHSQATRTISGIVSSVRDATSNGVEAHVVSLNDASGVTYTLFAWGRPTVNPGDAVEVDGIFTGATQSTGPPVYQGVATQVRRAK